MAKEEKRTEEPKAKPATAAEAASVTAAKAEAASDTGSASHRGRGVG